MHSNSILPANLLDIIFENRNKDYGAYVLRKNYNKRLSRSLMIMLALVSVFAAWQMLVTKNVAADHTLTVFIPGPSLSSSKPIEPAANKTIIHTQVKSSKTLNNRPVIVKAGLDEKIILVNNAGFSPNDRLINEGPPVEAPGLGGANAGNAENKSPLKLAVPVIDRSIPLNSPEVFPQFPGGMNELIKFLKRNLNTPRELQEGEEISVKVKFIVSFNGDLVGFSVLETGGEPFDNEVMRVLKKMPKWIPGKARGENVSAWFIVPVKFTISN